MQMCYSKEWTRCLDSRHTLSVIGDLVQLKPTGSGKKERGELHTWWVVSCCCIDLASSKVSLARSPQLSLKVGDETSWALLSPKTLVQPLAATPGGIPESSPLTAAMLASNGSHICRGSCKFFCPRPLHTPSPCRRSRKATQRIQAVGWVCRFLKEHPKLSYDDQCHSESELCRVNLHSIARTFGLQDPEGLLRAPQGGHISRRILQKEVEQNKEMQEELEKLKREKGEELERQREVSAATHRLLEFLTCDALHNALGYICQSLLNGAPKVVKRIDIGVWDRHAICHRPMHRWWSTFWRQSQEKCNLRLPDCGRC